MGLFKKKEPDMKCWNCDKFISHKKVKWKKRTFTNEILASGDNAEEKLEALNNLSDLMGKKRDEKTVASPNQIFGLIEYEYRGKCPECDFELTCFWKGEESFNKIEGLVIAPKLKPFCCNECDQVINREYQVWYSKRFVIDEKIIEQLLTICPKCNTEQGYPFEYNLESGVIE